MERAIDSGSRSRGFESLLAYIKFKLHPTGFEPVMSLWESDYESGAFDHLATDAKIVLELVGIEPTSIKIH